MMCLNDYLLIFCWVAGLISGIGLHAIYQSFKY